jgi:sarcosine oxidase, subunit alpha
MSDLRLATGTGIDRSHPLSFTFDGRVLKGFAGDTVASALLASGIRLVGRSFRLHRPRGILSCGVEEPNALVHLRLGAYEEPNVRATLMPVREGLEVFSQNRWPSLRWDVGELLDLVPRLFAAGFYHKTFIYPRWRVYEPMIRRMAGLGRVRNPQASAGSASQQDLETDVLVCGGGAAGIAAAQAAAQAGARVILMQSSGAMSRKIEFDRDRVQVFPATMAVGVFGDRVIVGLQDLGWGPEGRQQCLLRVRAHSIIVATGMLEQPLVFDNNDRPGVMLAGAISRYAERFGVRAGRRAVFVVNNDAAYDSVSRCSAAGIEVAAIVDSRTEIAAAVRRIASECGVPLFSAPHALRVRGRADVRAVSITDHAGRSHRIDCDLVGMSGGWIPNVHLFSQAHGDIQYDSSPHAYVPVIGSRPVYAVGGAAGLLLHDDIERQAVEIGRRAAHSVRGNATDVRPPDAAEFRKRPRSVIGPTSFPGRAHRQWLDFQHDVTMADCGAAVEQGYVHVEHFKRYTTTGMAVDQGKTSQRNSLDQLALLTRRTLHDLKPPTYRPPYTPLPLRVAAGPNVSRWYRPVRTLPCHDEHARLQAHFDDVGGWRRPLHYGTAAGRCTQSEIKTVRQGVGLFDSSPLGKFELTGPGALEFLNRLCVNNLNTLAIGRIRYVMLLRDDGTVLDDGTVARIAEHHFLLTTTSGNAERAQRWLREWAHCEWPQLEVLITPVTTSWGSITLSGPKARSVLQRAAPGLDLDPARFPHMSYRAGDVAQHVARICRVSFTGEVSYEINVAAGSVESVWRRLLDAGQPDHIQPYGIDALNILRTEKGYLHVGADTDATTTPLDLGWGPLIDRKEEDFVGRSALALAEYHRPERLHLVGVQLKDPRVRMLAGAHVLGSERGRSEGYLTSACFSPTLGCFIALARLERGREREGEELWVYDQGKSTQARVVPPTFYDPRNLRLNLP